MDILANIFDGLDTISDQEMREQVATLETVTLGNIMGIYGTKAHEKLAGAVNFIGGIFGKSDAMEKPQVREMDELIRESVQTLQYDSRDILVSRLEMILRKRSDITNQFATREDISIAVVDKAANYLEIDSALSPAEKIEATFSRYMERMYKKMREKAANQTMIEIRETIRIMDADIAAMSEADRESMRKALNVDKVTGETVHKILMTTGGSTLFLGAATGFGTYLALTTIMHAVFTTAIGITLPFAAYTGAASVFSFFTGPIGWILLAGVGIWQFTSGSSKVDGEVLSMTVFLARAAYKKPFVAAEEVLPSWIPTGNTQAREEREQQEALYVKLQEDYKNKSNEYEEEKRKRSDAERAEREAQKSLKKEKEREATARKNLVEVQQKKEHLEQVVQQQTQEHQDKVARFSRLSQEEQRQHRAELDRIKSDLDSTTRERDAAHRDISSYEAVIEEAGQAQEQYAYNIQQVHKQNIELEQSCNEYKGRAENAERKLREKNQKRGIELGRNWKNYFRNTSRTVDYQADFINDVADQYHDILVDIEKKMIEIYDAKNPVNIADRGRMNTKEKTLHASVRKKYRLHYLYDAASNTVTFVKFCSHNYQDKRF